MKECLISFGANGLNWQLLISVRIKIIEDDNCITSEGMKDFTKGDWPQLWSIDLSKIKLYYLAENPINDNGMLSLLSVTWPLKCLFVRNDELTQPN